MAQITNFPLRRRFRSEASAEVRVFKRGKCIRQGRGLAFWFDPAAVSIAEVPLADRELTFIVKAQSADYQDIAVQGTILWAVADVAVLADRVDFSIDLATGKPLGQPEDRVANILSGLARGFADAYVKGLGVRELLEAGLAPLQARIRDGFAAEPTLGELGLKVVSVRVAALNPSSELTRALQAPTFESMQQKADEASFARRAMAVEKERAIAENELANEIELASRRADLIVRQAANDRSKAEAAAVAARITAEGDAQAKILAADAEAKRIRAVEQAGVDMEKARMEAIGQLDAAKLYALAARELAGKLESIDSVTITPDMLGGLLRQVGLMPAMREG